MCSIHNQEHTRFKRSKRCLHFMCSKQPGARKVVLFGYHTKSVFWTARQWLNQAPLYVCTPLWISSWLLIPDFCVNMHFSDYEPTRMSASSNSKLRAFWFKHFTTQMAQPRHQWFKLDKPVNPPLPGLFITVCSLCAHCTKIVTANCEARFWQFPAKFIKS
jgi:hypothetical protein